MPHRLKDLDVEFISLVAVPANGFGLVLKRAGSRVFQLEKMDEERQVAYGIVYAPEQVDVQNDFTDRFEIEKAAYRFMKAKRQDQVDQNHDSQPLAGAYVAESWLVKSGDPWFPELVGAWAVGIKVEDAAIWESLKKGELQGLSMAGAGLREEVTKADDPEAFRTLFKSVLEQLQQLEQRVATLTTELPTQLQTLDTRLGTVEKQRWSLPAQATAVPAATLAKQIL